jgi:hypothetical membrane protein
MDDMAPPISRTAGRPAPLAASSSGWPLALAGPAAAVLFACSLFGFAAARTDGYTHGSKAVSELGAVGAPHATAFNVLAFVVPGMLVVVLAAAIRRAAGPRGARTGPALLAGSGLALVVAGVCPVDMAHRDSAGSIAHAAGAMLVGVCWAAGLFWLGPLLRRDLGLRTLGRLTPWFVLFLLANVAWQVAWQAGGFVLPGWGQRIGFAGYFAWVALAGLALASSRRERIGDPAIAAPERAAR